MMLGQMLMTGPAKSNFYIFFAKFLLFLVICWVYGPIWHSKSKSARNLLQDALIFIKNGAMFIKIELLGPKIINFVYF